MKANHTSVFALAPLLLAVVACAPSTRVTVELTQDTQGASAAPQTLADADAIFTTVVEVAAHVAGTAADELDGGADGGAEPLEPGWHVLSQTEHIVNLATLSGDVGLVLADATVPSGKVTQLRIRLKPGTDEGNGTTRLAGAVLVGGELCDLIAPASAFDPGIKILSPFKAQDGAWLTAQLSINLLESKPVSGASCAYFLSPTLRLDRVDTHP